MEPEKRSTDPEGIMYCARKYFAEKLETDKLLIADPNRRYPGYSEDAKRCALESLVRIRGAFDKEAYDCLRHAIESGKINKSQYEAVTIVRDISQAIVDDPELPSKNCLIDNEERLYHSFVVEMYILSEIDKSKKKDKGNQS